MKHGIAQAIIQSANRGNLCLRDKFVLRKKTSTSRNLAANTEHPAAIAVEDAETGGGGAVLTIQHYLFFTSLHGVETYTKYFNLSTAFCLTDLILEEVMFYLCPASQHMV